MMIGEVRFNLSWKLVEMMPLNPLTGVESVRE